jgi:hypothetical protein
MDGGHYLENVSRETFGASPIRSARVHDPTSPLPHNGAQQKKENTMKKHETFSERLFAEARLCRNLGDIKGAEAWERQAEQEREYEQQGQGYHYETV